MPRAIIDRSILDALIKAKLATLSECPRVKAHPVTWQSGSNGDCNWKIPGWDGEASVLTRCTDKMSSYISFLQAQFNIPHEG